MAPDEASAPVSGSGSFSIKDSLNNAITATLTLVNVDVWKPGANASSGELNNVNAVNLLSFSGYAGTDSRLTQLAGRSALLYLTFQFTNPGLSLSELMADGSHATSYNGTVSLVAIPEPSTTALGFALVSLFVVVARHRHRKFVG